MRAPAYQRRAPLRPVQGGRQRAGAAVLPPINGGLHCGSGTLDRYRCAWQVLPPINGGLHCGPQARCPPSRAATARAPAYQRRAPLRHPGGVVLEGDSDWVLPPINGGLHCGVRLRTLRAHGNVRCSRLSTAGSIAALLSRSPGRAGRPRAPAYQRRAPLRPGRFLNVAFSSESAPAYQRRAPLRQAQAGPDSRMGDACSRLSTAGSIAARWRGT